MNLFPKAVSTYLSDGSIAVFSGRARPDLVKFLPNPSAKEVSASQRLLHSTHVVRQYQPDACIHRDVRLPFGEELTLDSVEQSLIEVLGGRRDEFNKARWHEMFAEDTHQGTEHRVFISLFKSDSPSVHTPADAQLPLQVGLMALANHLSEVSEKPEFQFLIQTPKAVFSILVFGSSVFHTLTFQPSDDIKSDLDRLARQRDYGLQSAEVESALPLYVLAPNAAAWQELALTHNNWEVIPLPSILNIEATKTAAQKVQLYCHLGLRLAQSDLELRAHNSVGSHVTRSLGYRRDKRLAIYTTLIAALFCLLVGGFFGLRYKNLQQRLQQIDKQSDAHRPVLQKINAYRQQKSAVSDSLTQLRQLWHLPIPWDKLLLEIQNAMPRQSGIEALVVKETQKGATELQFKAWVKNWDHITGIQKRLTESPYFLNVKESEQRKNKRRHYISFNMSAEIRKF